jgi:hypothetical protein
MAALGSSTATLVNRAPFDKPIDILPGLRLLRAVLDEIHDILPADWIRGRERDVVEEVPEMGFAMFRHRDCVP